MLEELKASTYIDQLIEESVFILRETAAQFQNPYILFSGGKDSITLVHLAMEAFSPLAIPFKLLHVDTGHNFKEALDFRDRLVKEYGLTLEVRYVADTIQEKKLKEPTGKFASRNALQSFTLLDAIQELQIDCCIGGGRRDEEKARAKERVFSHRDKQGSWQPDQQNPELWNVYNGLLNPGENYRVFPISNWTERDVWQFIKEKNISLPSIYFSHNRSCIHLPGGQLLAVSEFIQTDARDTISTEQVRFRTVGDMTCTAAVPSKATTVDDILKELDETHISERGATRIDDKISESGMEDRKKQGYF
ncbi:MAG: sulfate adenylyltransferase subunit 2 [Bacteroidetes bacterium]|nr:sulfate adenylyltransferase subunit 2 [Bacteroidota bacterium]